MAAELDGETIGVAIVGRPVARALQDGFTAEVTRTCTLPGAPKGAVSFLYSACRRAAFALGYRKLITYTLASESGASLRGAGWQMEMELKPRPGWDAPSRKRGEGTVDNVAKRRWAATERWLANLQPPELIRDSWASDPDDDFKGMYGTSKPASEESTNAKTPEPPQGEAGA
jgi:hypothetical protein